MTTGAIAQAEGAARGRGVRVAVFLAMNAVYFFAFFHRVAVPGTIFDELQSEFRASASAIAGLGAIYLYIYAGMQLFSGMMSDRMGPVRVLLAGGALLAAGSLAFPIAPSLGYLYASRALIGLGASLIYLSVVKGVDGLFHPRRFAELLGATMFLGYSGGLAGTLPFERAVHAWGWRPVLLVVGVLCAAAVVCAAALFRRLRPAQPTTTGLPMVLGSVLRNRLAMTLVFASSTNFAIYFLIQATLGKKLLLDCARLGSAGAAAFTFLMMLTTMCLGLAGGFLSRLAGNRRKPFVIASISLTLLGVACLLACVRWHLGAGWYLAGLLLLAASAIGSPVGIALMKELNAPGAAGTTTGVLNASAYLAVGLLVTLSGRVMDHFQDRAVRTAGAVVYPMEAYAVVLALCLAAAMAALAASLLLRESHGKMLHAD